MFASRFLDYRSTDFEKVYSLVNSCLSASLTFCMSLDISASCPRKWSQKGRTVDDSIVNLVPIPDNVLARFKLVLFSKCRPYYANIKTRE